MVFRSFDTLSVDSTHGSGDVAHKCVARVVEADESLLV